jgi:uncharacterized repeat protein (TIGR03847 family)
MGTEERYELDEVTLLSAFAVGAPGKRTFFLAIGDKNKWLRVWLEKEHLKALAMGIDQLLSTLSQEGIRFRKDTKAPPISDDTPSDLPSAELDIAEIALGYEKGKATIELLVQRSGAQEQKPAEVYCRATSAQLKMLGSQATSICAAGRPLCPECGGPIDPTGHVCPARN